MGVVVFFVFFFFKQKTAYEMSIGDWSSDVCSSDLLAPDSPTRRWEGGHFLGYVAASEEGKGKDYWFRAHHNGITFGLSEKEWKSVQALFREAWELPEIRMAWDSLTLEYGEL